MDFELKIVFSNFLEVCFKYLSHFRKIKNTTCKLIYCKLPYRVQRFFIFKNTIQ